MGTEMFAEENASPWAATTMDTLNPLSKTNQLSVSCVERSDQASANNFNSDLAAFIGRFSGRQ
jgi:hypothetical protein